MRRKGNKHSETLLPLKLYIGKIVAKKIGDQSCQSNFDTRASGASGASDFGSFLII